MLIARDKGSHLLPIHAYIIIGRIAWAMLQTIYSFLTGSGRVNIDVIKRGFQSMLKRIRSPFFRKHQ